MASGDTLIVLYPQDGEPPDTGQSPSLGYGYATLDTRNGVLVLDFDDTSDEAMNFACFMPRHYAGGGVTVVVGWMATSATSGTISLDVAFMSVSDDADDLDLKDFATPQNTNPTAASVSGEVDYASVEFTNGAQMDSVAAGEYFRLQVKRDADGTTSTDNMSGDMELVFVEIRET